MIMTLGDIMKAGTVSAVPNPTQGADEEILRAGSSTGLGRV